jgi:hypothetical protein
MTSSDDDVLLNDAFNGVNEKLNTSFSSIPEKISEANTQIEVIDNQVKELDSIIKGNTSLPDEDYLREQIKFLVDQSKDVLKKLQLEIKIGSGDKIFSAWADAINATTGLLRELREMSTWVADTVAKKENPANKPAGKNNISMTLDNLLELISKASSENSMNSIDATFEVAEESKDN